MDEDRLAGDEPAAVEHVGPDGEIGLGKSRSLDHRHADGDRQGVVLRDHRVIRIAAARHQRHHGVAHGEIACA
jgi:hypothetical protein